MLSRKVRKCYRLCFAGRVRTGTLNSDEENDAPPENAALLNLVPATWTGWFFQCFSTGMRKIRVREFRPFLSKKVFELIKSLFTITFAVIVISVSFQLCSIKFCRDFVDNSGSGGFEYSIRRIRIFEKTKIRFTRIYLARIRS
jgi:hypothetical protein